MDVNVYAAKTQLSRLIDRAGAGEEVVITRNGKPVAKLVRIDLSAEPRQLGRLAGRLHIPDDFDDPLPDDVLDAFEGRS